MDELHRTLVRVVGIDEDGVWLFVPGWNSSVAVLRPVMVILRDIEGVFIPGHRFFAMVNIGAESADDLQFSDFKFAEQD
jgi:hypothetical protein